MVGNSKTDLWEFVQVVGHSDETLKGDNCIVFGRNEFLRKCLKVESPVARSIGEPMRFSPMQTNKKNFNVATNPGAL